MPTETAAIVAQIDAALREAEPIASRLRSPVLDRPPGDVLLEVTLRLLSTLSRLAPQHSVFRETYLDIQNDDDDPPNHIFKLIGTLKALRTEFQAGYLASLAEIIHADTFADFLEMASYLLEQGYKDAAAVIAGSVLEQRLRDLCLKHLLPIVDANNRPKKAETMNVDLRAASVYPLNQQKDVTAWLGLRNSAAHGQYNDYDVPRVRVFIDSIRLFLSLYPA